MVVPKNISKLVLVALLFYAEITFTFGQDIHFSQFYNSPINLSPAESGLFAGDYRFAFNERTQWRSVTVPYQTYGISAEAKSLIEKYNVNGALGIYYDKAGDSKFTTVQIAPVLSKQFNVKDSVHFISAGLTPAFTQRSINYDELYFDEQYNGSYFDNGLPVTETFQRTSRAYINLHFGAAYEYRKGLRKAYKFGWGLFNFFKPKQSFFNVNDIRLQRRNVFYGKGIIKVNDDFDAIPQFSLMKQKEFSEFVIGGQAKYYLRNGNYKAAYLGLFYRNKDAGFLTIGLDYAQWHFEVSYDVNVSKLVPASNARGGLEIGIIYIFEKFKPVIKRFKYCPDYL